MSESASHGALMDGIYRQQRHIYDITREYYLLGRDRLIAELDPPQGGSVLEVACGTGRNLARVGKTYPNARLYGFDISEQMLVTAQASLSRKGMGARVQLAQGDACNFDPQALFGVEKFDRIFLSYCLSMIPDWQGALSEAARHLAPGGQLAVVDFGDQEALPGWFRTALQAWLEKFHVSPRVELDAALARTAQAVGGTARMLHLRRDYCRYGVITLPG
ncbi:MAG: class I SAM-dependent methyltransferase [Mangrovicoccus sp.]|nr:class I SAM-dependent methyltransferase [Mangrovicoccus sp.]